ncbi:MAG: isocitrate lyase [Chloroflexota bacterium]
MCENPHQRWRLLMGKAGRKFRELLATEPYVFTTGVFTPIEARLAELVGLKCVYMSGYSCALGYLARADLGFPTMTEMTTWARYIASVVDIPVIADADDAYGNAIIAMRTVEEFEKTGVAGIHVEDQRFPKRCGHLAGKIVLPREEAVKKFKAIVDARSDPDFFIIARTDARNAVGGSLEEAIERAKAYADVGVDMVWCEFPTPDRAEAEKFAVEVRKAFPNLPLAFNYSSSFRWVDVENPLTFRELGEMGYKYIFITLGSIHAAMYAVWNFMADLRDNQEQAQFRLQRMKLGHPTENHHKLGRFEYFKELEEKYLPAELVETRYTQSEGFGAKDFKPKGVLL